MGKTISLYLSDEAIAKLDVAVERRAAADRIKGVSGRNVTSRSSFVEELIDACPADPPVLTREEISHAVVSLAKEYGAAKVSLFGSHARGEATSESDVDLLLEKGDIKGVRVLDFQDDLAKRLGRPVDVVTTAGASERFLDRISQDAVVLYEVVDL